MKSSLAKVPNGPEPTLRKADALARLGVTEEQLSVAPNLDPILKDTCGGKTRAIDAMRFSDQPLVEQFLAKYDSIPDRDRKSLTFTAIALAAEINVRHLLGEMLLAIREHSVSRVKFIAITAHPDVTRSRVKYAQEVGGFRDRDALDTMLGALPKGTGISIMNKIFTGTEEKPETEESAPIEELEDDTDVVFPDASKMQERVQPMRQRLLEGK